MRFRNSNKVVFNLLGGIGNQLFIYFAGQYLKEITGKSISYEPVRLSAKDSNHKSKLEELNLGVLVDIKQSSKYRLLVNYGMRLINRFPSLSSGIYVSKVTGFDPKINRHLRARRIHGYFQTFRYYENLSSDFKLGIGIRNPSPSFKLELENLTKENPICLHIRRGDYHDNPNFGLLSKEYYKNSLKIIENEIGERKIWIFSDDMNGAANLMDFISSERLRFMVTDLSDTESLILMANSTALIIANSTYSYWAGVIGNQSKLVVAPSKWFRHLDDPTELYPMRWLRSISLWEGV